MPDYVLRACIGGLAAALLLSVLFFAGREAVAEPAAPAPPAGAAPAPPPVRVPGFWDPRRRPEKPDLARISVIRFLTETDYPPFNYAGADGNLQGFNIDLARMLCEELRLACTIQMRRFARRGLPACQAELLFAAMPLNLGKLLHLDPRRRAAALPA